VTDCAEQASTGTGWGEMPLPGHHAGALTGADGQTLLEAALVLAACVAP
jgi:hypothetical protein